MKKAKPFYKTKRWRSKRDRILRSDGYQCQEDKRYGGGLEANMVHHIYPLELYPEIGLSSWNLISLSNKWHGKMHNRLTDEVTELGKQWQKRREREFTEFYGKPPLL